MKKTFLAAFALALLVLPLAHAQDAPVPTQIVDELNKIYGTHPGARANHAKGVVVEGSFQPSKKAASLSRSPLFKGGKIPVTVRFSDSGGLPTVPDGDPGANPHGMAIKFHLAKGGETDMVINSLKFFPVATGEEFRDFLLAIEQSPPGGPKPTKLDQFMAQHPRAPAALGTLGTPDSFADETYYGIDAFIFVDRKGHKQAVRYVMAPEKTVHLTPEDAAARPADFLVDDLPKRVAQHPVVFHLKAQLAGPNDQTKDPSQAWPEDRPVVDLGTLTLSKTVANSADAEKHLLFLPTRLTDGIELSDDELPAVRSAAYGVSFGRRSQ